MVELILGFRRYTQHNASTSSNVLRHHPCRRGIQEWNQAQSDATRSGQSLYAWDLIPSFFWISKWVNHIAWTKTLLDKRNTPLDGPKPAGDNLGLHVTWSQTCSNITRWCETTLKHRTPWNGHKTYSNYLLPEVILSNLLEHFTCHSPICLAAACSVRALFSPSRNKKFKNYNSVITENINHIFWMKTKSILKTQSTGMLKHTSRWFQYVHIQSDSFSARPSLSGKTF